MIKAEELASSIPNSRKIAEGRYVAQCPVHGGGDSFYISDGDKGTLLYCHAGCSVHSILKALDLNWQDLFGQPGVRRKYDPSNDALVMALYRQQLKDKKEIGAKDGRLVSAASDRLFRNGYRQQPDGSYAN